MPKPTTDELRDLLPMSPSEAMETCEARGLLPVGWCSDPQRGWWRDGQVVDAPQSVDHLLTVVAQGYDVPMLDQPCPQCAYVDNLSPRVDSSGRFDVDGNIATRRGDDLAWCTWCRGTGTVHIPLGWDGAEELAKSSARRLVSHGYRGSIRRVVWRVERSLEQKHNDYVAWRSRASKWCVFSTGEFAVGPPDDMVTKGRLPSIYHAAIRGLRVIKITNTEAVIVCPVLNLDTPKNEPPMSFMGPRR